MALTLASYCSLCQPPAGMSTAPTAQSPGYRRAMLGRNNGRASGVSPDGGELRVVLPGALGTTIVFEEEPETLVASSVAAVAVMLAAPVLAPGGGTPLLQRLVSAARTGSASGHSQGDEHLVDTHRVGGVTYRTVVTSRRTAEEAVMPSRRRDRKAKLAREAATPGSSQFREVARRRMV